MKKLLLGFATLLFAVIVSAQTPITLSQSSYTSAFANTNDTVLTSIISSSYPTLTAATNASWDMTGAVSTTSVASILHVNPYTSGFASAQYADSGTYSFGPFSYQASVQNAIAPTAFLEYGEHIYRKGFSLVGVAPGATTTDSFVVDAQNDIYSTPRTAISFPATYHSTWTSNYNLDFTYHLTYTIVYNNVPGYVREFITELDSVVGWGQMRVLELNGDTSGYMDVLQIRSDVSVMDSFYLNGSPAPSALLSSFNVTQGMVTVSNTQYYVRPNEVTPLAEVSFDDSTYSSANGAQTHAQRLAAGPAGVATLINNGNIAVYPNPVVDRNIYLDIPTAKANDRWTYDLTDINGKNVLCGNLLPNIVHAQIKLPSELSSGIYYLNVSNKGILAASKALDITR